METPDPRIVPARDAAAVVLGRDGARGLEVLLLQRHPDSRFSPGAYAFPGGRVESADADGDAERFCHGLTRAAATATLPDVQPPGRAIGFWLAALREVFEETGILLACTAAGRPAVAQVDATRLREYRVRCRADPATFRVMLAERSLVLATDRMAYLAHWITPEERPVRYDARFFAAAALRGDEIPEPDGSEAVGAGWFAPATVLACQAEGTMTLPFPTQQILRALTSHQDVAGLLAAARTGVVKPVRPRVVVADGRERILLPGEPGYF